MRGGARRVAARVVTGTLIGCLWVGLREDRVRGPPREHGNLLDSTEDTAG